jgi:hypothetical protein
MVDLGQKILGGINNTFDAARGVVRGSVAIDPQGFTAGGNLPSPSGNQVRQAKIDNLRTATAVRNMVRFFLPETGIVEMYVNPQSIKYNDKKHIPSPTRTRGGYIIQYWGEELGTVSISGITGSSGVEGINVLYDVYRNEQVSMDALALATQAARDQQSTGGILDAFASSDNFLEGAGNLIGAGVDSLFDSVTNVIESGNIDPGTPKPTLASIAFQTEMYWSGWVFRGYFTSMSVSESADKLGLFDYTMEFTVTQKRGLRLNFMPWHRSAVHGPSNSDPAFGPPYSFSTLDDPIPRQNVNDDDLSRLIRFSRTVDQALQSYRPL